MSTALIAATSIVALKKCLENIWSFWKADNMPVKVLVTGAAGDIGNAIVPMIARGLMLGAKQPVILHMLDENARTLKEREMELIDAALPLLKGVVATDKAEEACKGVQVAVMIGSLPRKEREVLRNHADKDCKVLVVENPANAKALKWEELAPKIDKKNITYLTRLEHNIALGQIAKKANVHVSDVKNVIIRGNDHSTRYLDVNYAIVTTLNGQKSVRDYVTDDNWLDNNLETTVTSRARNRSSALSIASSACDHVRDWLLGTPEGTCVSMGVHSDEPDGIYSFPVTCDGGEWSIVKRFHRDTKEPIVDKKKKNKANARGR